MTARGDRRPNDVGELVRAARVVCAIRPEAVVGHFFKREFYATSNPNETRCRCIWPRHGDDRNPSLRVNHSKQMLYCDVCRRGTDTAGLVARQLHCSKAAAYKWLVAHAAHLPEPAIRPAVPPTQARAPRGMPGQAPPPAGRWTTYNYYDTAGRLLCQKVRTPAKGFFWRRRLPSGAWRCGLGNIKPPLYALPLIRHFPFVFVVEGEKDVDAAWDHDLPATTNPEGAGPGKWRAVYSKTLNELGIERVYVVPDNDEIGYLHAREVVASCRRAGLGATLIELPGLPPKGDLSDYLAMGGTGRELMRRCREPRDIR